MLDRFGWLADDEAFLRMDEIDAALDFKNVSIVAHYIKVSPCSLNFKNQHIVN